MADTARAWPAVALVLLMADLAEAACYGAGAVAGIAIGTALATLLIVAIIIAVLYYCRKKKAVQNENQTKLEAGGRLGYDNPTFTADEAELKAREAQHKDQGFAGYVQCREIDVSATPS